MDEQAVRPATRLSVREQEIARLIADGCTNAEIAEQLGITFATAKWHVSEIISKLGVESREEVAERWKQEHSLRRRLQRMTAATVGALSLKPAAAVLAGGAATVVVGTFVVLALASRSSEAPRIAIEPDGNDGSFLVAPRVTAMATVASLGQVQLPPHHIVAAGDTCASIAATYDMPEQVLIERNPEVDPLCTNLRVGQLLQIGIPAPSTQEAGERVRLADRDGDPTSATAYGQVDPRDGLKVWLEDHSNALPPHESAVGPFREWQLFLAGGSSADGVGGEMLVAGSDRIARIHLVVDGGPPTPYTPELAPPELGYPLRVLYVTLPPGRVWEFWAYDADGNYMGTVTHGSGVGAGEAYVEATAPGGPPPPPPVPRADQIDGMSNGHVLATWPEFGAQVTRAETAALADPLARTGVCALIDEVGRGPDISLANVEFRVDGVDVTAQLNRYPEGDPATSRRATLCYAPEGGLQPGIHNAMVSLRQSADGNSGSLGFVPWQFEVVSNP